MSLLHLTEEDLYGTNLQFENGERVRFMIEEFVEDESKGMITLHNRVMTSDHKFTGKKHVYSLFKYFPNGNLNPDFLAFLRAFFTDEEIMSKKVLAGKLEGRLYAVTVNRTPSKKDKSVTYQNYRNFKDEGMGTLSGKAEEPVPF